MQKHSNVTTIRRSDKFMGRSYIASSSRHAFHYPPLRGRRSMDAVIIGGGLSGVTIALWLVRSGLKVALLEAETLGFGATAQCGGMISLLGGASYLQTEKRYGAEGCGAYAQTGLAAFRSVRELACGQNASCGWRDMDAYLISEAKTDLLSNELEAMRRAGLPITEAKPTHCPIPAAMTLCLKDMASLDASRYFKQLISEAERLGAEFYENSRVTALETNLALTARGSVLSPYVIVATGYPIVNTPGWYFSRLTQRKKCALRLDADARGQYADALNRYTLYEQSEGLTLEMHLVPAGAKTRQSPEEMYRKRFASYLDNAPILGICEGLTIHAPDGLPYIGAYGRDTPNMFVATGYAGRGILGSILAAQTISARILGLTDTGHQLYSGQRNLIAASARASAGIAARYALSLFRRAPRCTHMGCKLRYNEETRIWECPCHGSRFDAIGRVLNAPAVKDGPIRRS